MIKNKYFVILLLLFCSNSLFAQAPAWGGGSDQHDQSFGFYFSYVTDNFKITKKPNWRNPYFDQGSNRYVTDSLSSIGSKSSPGFAIGLLTRYRLTEHLEARLNPSLVFADRSLSYVYNNTPSENV